MLKQSINTAIGVAAASAIFVSAAYAIDPLGGAQQQMNQQI